MSADTPTLSCVDCTRKGCKKHDMDYPPFCLTAGLTEEELDEMCRLYREDWLATSRPFGFELIQRRNAAALERFEEAKRRFDDFMAGRAATIEECDEAIQPFGATQERPVIGW